MKELIVLLCYITLCKYETQIMLFFCKRGTRDERAWEVPEMPEEIRIARDQNKGGFSTRDAFRLL